VKWHNYKLILIAAGDYQLVFIFTDYYQ